MKSAFKDFLRSWWYKLRLQRAAATLKISAAFARAAATATTRCIDPAVPRTWEFSGFSQHGEDGIIDYLCSRMLAPNLYFFEIGSADGLENCTAWLALGRNYGGVMVEGNAYLSERSFHSLHGRLYNVVTTNLMVNVENVASLMKSCPYLDPDVLVIDIDSIDYYVLKRILELNFRPKLIVVEYNSAFGPEMAVTIPYRENFGRFDGHPSGLYYGVSIAAWTKLLGPYGYRFVTVESAGCNGFYIDPKAFPDGFASSLRGIPFLENIGDLHGGAKPYRDSQGDLVVPKREWQQHFELIRDLPLVKV